MSAEGGGEKEERWSLFHREYFQYIYSHQVYIYFFPASNTSLYRSRGAGKLQVLTSICSLLSIKQYALIILLPCSLLFSTTFTDLNITCCHTHSVFKKVLWKYNLHTSNIVHMQTIRYRTSFKITSNMKHFKTLVIFSAFVSEVSKANSFNFRDFPLFSKAPQKSQDHTISIAIYLSNCVKTNAILFDWSRLISLESINLFQLVTYYRIFGGF